MLINPAFILANPWPILGFTAALIMGKTAITTGAVMAGRIPVHVAILTGVALAQVGEFSFILLQAASAAGAIEPGPYQVFLSCSVLSMALTPPLFACSRKMIQRFAKSWNPQVPFGRSSQGRLKDLENLNDHVIICGFGLGGQNIGRVLKANRIPYVVIDLNEQRVREARKEGESILFGDCTSTHILELAGIRRSRVIVFVISDPFASRLAVRAAREMSREIVVLTRTKYVADIDALWDQGSNEVISEEFEASLELMTRILRVYNAPRAMVAAEIKSIRDQRFGIFRERHTTVPRMREETGVLILGIIRENQTLNNPWSSETICAGDRLVLSGTKEQLKNAVLRLNQNRSGAKAL
jgi:CPA2 family monovalent cation:H+ antiporter-2